MHSRSIGQASHQYMQHVEAYNMDLQAGYRGLHTDGALAAPHGGHSSSASSFPDYKGQCPSCPFCNVVRCR